MKLSLSRKLFLAVLGTALLGILAMGAADGWSFARGFLGYINGLTEERVQAMLPQLRAYYRQQGTWAPLRGAHSEWFELTRPPGGSEAPDWEMPVSDLTGAGLRIALLDAAGEPVVRFVELGRDAPRWPIEVEGQTVGWLAMAPFQNVTEAGGALLIKRQLLSSLAVGVLVSLLAALIARWASRRLVAPVQRVAAATHRLAAGDYSERVRVQTDDEVGQLARDFNQLAFALERNEQMRREFMADISHELRTPLAVLRGELEALEDGVRTLDAASLRSLQQEVALLSKLVADLSELSLADVGALTYRKSRVDLVELLELSLAGAAKRCQERDLTLDLRLPADEAPLLADAGRLQQLFGNLLENSLRYTDAGGRLQVAVTRRGAQVVVDWMDSTPGVPDTDLPRLVERFYRGEASRRRATGGSGLGLAICRSIVEAHGGTLEARHSPLGGLWLQLILPAENG
ncbi:ATP-binding protein [Stutzerimonas chloritidismutans]|uniref:ATP-binding protein n=1 Tax=Stutzerimonas chloritidismutans TaxID=203192 RepID=UPI003F190650